MSWIQRARVWVTNAGPPAQEGFWVLVQIGLTGTAEDAETVADICEYFELGGDKAAFYQAELRERMRAKTKRGRRV